MSKKHFISILLSFMMITVLSGCFIFGSGRKEYDPKDPTRSMAYGYIDMKDYSSMASIGYAYFRQYLPKPEIDWYCNAVDGSIFVSPVIPKSYIRLHSFYSSGAQFFLGTSKKNPIAIQINKPGMYFIGAYKYKRISTGFFEAEKYTLIPIKSPTHREILVKILKYYKEEDKEKYSRQIKMINKRLNKLK